MYFHIFDVFQLNVVILFSDQVIPLRISACMQRCFSCVQLFTALWNVACQAPLSMGILQARILEARILCCCALLQGILPAQGLNPHRLHLLHRQGVLYY